MITKRTKKNPQKAMPAAIHSGVVHEGDFHVIRVLLSGSVSTEKSIQQLKISLTPLEIENKLYHKWAWSKGEYN